MLDDADFQKLMPVFLQQVMNNTGQTCTALGRMLVPRSRYEEAVSIAKAFAEKTTVGYSDDPCATIGPLVSEVQWGRVQEMLNSGIREGARVVTGGPGKPVGLEDGFFVKPTIFADVSNNMRIAQEEIFGPVISLIPYDSEEEAIAIANDTVYGLANAVASSDGKRALRVARELKSGVIYVNGTARDLTSPFGGFKQSGNAREGGIAGLQEFLITKSLNVPVEEYQTIC
eukprot:gnl/MRDRNA2_/MRDRNA2_461645_c0_seq1.p1 gnl/MRDRNA2_/MRDRNA2_461645_c0~~gnl/MRDRNA2_/MRDRNA2_461645_c0_seq1.p1  ORF type:complete len:242 (-),score=66.56 gnl/MRDRNA2_/MRDRNA2_461645_c0_seq1:136-822(-)